MQPFQYDLQPEILKHPITTHTHKQTQCSFKPPLHCAKEKKANRPQPQPRGTFHRWLQPLYTGKHKVSCSGFLPKTEPLQHHKAIPMRSATGDSKTPYNYAHTSRPKAASSHHYTAARKKANRPQPQPPHRRGTFQRRLQPLYTEKHKVSCPGFLPKTEPMQHSAAITMRFAASTRKLAPIYAQDNTRTLDDNSHAAIPMRSATGDSKTPYNYTHTSRPKAASSHHYTAAKKKANRPQPQPPHRRGTFHRRLQPLYTEKHKVSCPGFLPKTIPMQHSCSHSNAICNHSFKSRIELHT